MREIKFRAWDNTENKMVYSTGLYGKMTNKRFVVPNEYDVMLQFDMQYTGLKDKNSVEIYEGDILAWDYDGERDLYKVIYDAPSFKYSHIENPEFVGSTKAFDELESLDFEVIGNVYENSELLK